MAQDVNITVEDGGLGILAPSSDDVHAVLGTCSQGSTSTVFSTRSISDLHSTYGWGPGVQAAAFAMQVAGTPVLFLRVPTTTAGVAGTVTHTNPGSSVVTVTGAAYDTYSVVWKSVNSATATIATGPVLFQYSLDGGVNWSAVHDLGTATTYAIPNTNLTLHFAAGNILVNTVESFSTTEPLWAIADVQTAIGILGAGVDLFRFIHIVGNVTGANVTSLETTMDSLANNFRYCFALTHARDYASGDTNEAGWITSIETDFAAVSAKRLATTAGHYMVTSPLDGWAYRRPLSFVIAARLISKPIHVDAGRVKDGALPGLAFSLTDGNVYHDERNTPGLDTARFITARTLIGRQGMYCTNPNMMSPSGSDFIWTQYRSVIDKACSVARDVLLNFLSSDVRLNTSGFILEKDARDIESRLGSAFRDTLVSPGSVSSVSASVSRVDNIISTRTINVTIRVVPLGYLKTINVSVGFTNPALQIAA
jgi:hypothetical protein